MPVVIPCLGQDLWQDTICPAYHQRALSSCPVWAVNQAAIPSGMTVGMQVMSARTKVPKYVYWHAVRMYNSIEYP